VSRLAYLGTPALAVAPLRALVAAGHEVVAVVTRADKRRGRGGELLPSPVKVAATELGIPVHHRVDDLLGGDTDRDIGGRDGSDREGSDRHIDLGVVVAFGQLIRPHVLDVIPMVNLHFSLLPRWRGAAPVERAFLAGDEVTGVSLMQLEEGLDTGPVYERREVSIRPDETADELRAELVDVGTEILVRRLNDGLGEPEPQVGEATYAAKLRPEELRVDWAAGPIAISRLVRFGGAWTELRGKRLKVLAVEVAAGIADTAHTVDVVGGVRLLRVQPEGRGPMSFADFARGARLAPGERFG
jgi:methionyl-tRNA formyltransferase